jgi:2-C-methyl-D-erythritol 4-phosphate cytidylyltransferase
MKAFVIIVAAGLGTRLKSKTPKALALLAGKPLIWYSLNVFERHAGIDGIIIVGHKRNLRELDGFRRRYQKITAVVPGGKTRADSVRCGLQAVPAAARRVMVHDAARPLLEPGMVSRLLAAVSKGRAALLGVPVKATIKLVGAGSSVERTLPRDVLWEAQTPQAFQKDILIEAHSRGRSIAATDDAMLVEHMGVKVTMVLGSYRNLKITTPEDLRVAESLLGWKGKNS